MHGLTNGLQSIGQILIGPRGTAASIHLRVRSPPALSFAQSLYHSSITGVVCMHVHPTSKSTNILCSLDFRWNCGSESRGYIRGNGGLLTPPIAICADRDLGEANCAIQDLPRTYTRSHRLRP